MAKFSSQYKQIGPTRRIVAGENTYEKGMQFTEHPLPAGAAHTLLNLEIDSTDYSLGVAGGLHITDIASGCNFFDRAVFGAVSNQVIILQGRNEYCARAFEGITNILSIQKLVVKNNQTLAEEIRQQGFTADDVVCYKLITYNPINHRLMSVTLIQAPRDKYFTVSKDYKLRRLQVNPISCGFSEVWSTPDGGTYISNITDYHPIGADDHYIPRARRNNFDETYGQTLHSPYYMQTLAHCEGFGNKTFCFLHKKQIEIEGPLTNLTVVTRANMYTVLCFSATSAYFVPGDIITIVPNRTLESYENSLVLRVAAVREDTTVDPAILGIIADVDVLSAGLFKWSGTPDTDWAVTVRRNNIIINATLFSGFKVESVSISSLITDISAAAVNTQYDIYLRNCNTGIAGNYSSQAVINGVPVPVDAYRFGIVMTSVMLGFDGPVSPLPVMDPDELYSTALLASIKSAGTFDADKTKATIEVDLNTGRLRRRPGTPNVLAQFCALPAIRGNASGAGYTTINPLDPDTGLFSSGIGLPAGRISLNSWTHPATFIRPSILNTLRIGQGFRIAVFAKSAVPLTRSLNTLREDPLKSEYYDQQPTAVYILDYVWNGTTWEFSFLDTRKVPDALNPTLVENWESLPDTRDAAGNRITRHYIWVNRLAYLDVITEDNQDNMAQHLVDTAVGKQMIYDTAEHSLTGVSAMAALTYNINETLDAWLGGQEEFDNKSKLFDTAYGHFDITPLELTPSEASRWGYNMLSPAPYVFKCQDTPGLEPLLTGLTLMRDGVPLLKPLINTEGVLYIYFNADQPYVGSMVPERYQLTLEYKNQFDDWRTLKEFSVSETHTGLASGVPFKVPFTSPDEIVLIKMQILNKYQKTEVLLTDGTIEEHFNVTTSNIVTLSYARDPAQVQTTPAIYNLGTALGLTYWKSRLVAWGVLGAENQIFMSEVSQPEYWPYPNNIDLFEENITHIIPYSDSLIVFTSTKLWRLDMLSDGLSWRKTLIQQNLRIVDKDIPYICLLKNMLFFKSDKQFYMLVPQKGSVVGDITIAPISKPIQNFLLNPFEAIKGLIPRVYKELANKEHPINEYLIKYGTHVEQMKVYVNWWFDLTAFKNQEAHITDRVVQHDVVVSGDSASLLEKEYWLVQLIYDAQLYAWTLRTHTSDTVGVFISDAANTNTDFVSLVFCPEITTETVPGSPLFEDTSGTRWSKSTWGVSIAHRDTPEDSLLWQFSLTGTQVIPFEPTYPRFQVLDTGYKEVSTPALLKRFREAQLFMQPKGAKEVTSQAPSEWLQQLIEFKVPAVAESPELVTPYMSSQSVEATTGNTVALKVLLDIFVDGHQILSSVQPEVRYEPTPDGVLQIKIIDTFVFIESPFTVDAELSNTFILDSSALTGVKLVRFRKTVNGKGQLIRMRFCNLTETDYALFGHAFVAHNKNAR